MSAINFLKQRLETSPVMKKSLVFQPHLISDAIKTMENQSLQTYGNDEVESLSEKYPDLNKGDLLTGWISVKHTLTNISAL